MIIRGITSFSCALKVAFFCNKRDLIGKENLDLHSDIDDDAIFINKKNLEG